MIPDKAINITGGIPPEIYVAIGRGRYEGEQGDYDLARDVAAAVRAECKATIDRLTGLLHFAQSFLEEAQMIIPKTGEMQAWHDCVIDWQVEAAKVEGGENDEPHQIER